MSNEYKYCERCKKRFSRPKSFWNAWETFALCPKCEESYENWWNMHEIKVLRTKLEDSQHG